MEKKKIKANSQDSKQRKKRNRKEKLSVKPSESEKAEDINIEIAKDGSDNYKQVGNKSDQDSTAEVNSNKAEEKNSKQPEADAIKNQSVLKQPDANANQNQSDEKLQQ